MKGELLKPGAGWMEPSIGLEKLGGLVRMIPPPDVLLYA